MRQKRHNDKCPECKADELFYGYFDDDGYACDDTAPGVAWRAACNQCGWIEPVAHAKPASSQ